MSVEKARAHYLGENGKKKMNCAQSVAAAFIEEHGLGEEILTALAGCGGGKAPGGRCGALHAAQLIIGEAQAEKSNKCEAYFLFHAGSTKCSDIRSMKKLSCPGCVEKAARFLSGDTEDV